MDSTKQADMAQVTNGVEPSSSLINRIRTSYRLALRRAPNPEDSALWSMIGAKQADIHAALMSDDIEALRSLLSDPRQTNLYYGVDNLAKDVIAMDPGDSWKGGWQSIPFQDRGSACLSWWSGGIQPGRRRAISRQNRTRS